MNTKTNFGINYNDLVCIILCLLLSFFAAIFSSARTDAVGTDTKNYIDFFYKTSSGVVHRIDEPVFLGIAYLAGYFYSNHILFFFLVSFLSFSALIFFYYAFFDSFEVHRRRWALVFFALALTLIFP